MKNIVFEVDKEKININDINVNCHYIGVAYRTGERGFVSREKFNGGNFRVLSPEGITNGNQWVDYHDENFLIFAQKLRNTNCKLFCFESFLELMKWVAGSKI